MYSDVKVIIEQKRPVTGAGSGLPLLFAGCAEQGVPYTECAGMEEVRALFGAQSKLTRAAEMLFIQNRAPEKVAVMSTEKTVCDGLPEVFEKNWRQLLVCTEAQEEDTLENVAELLRTQEGKVLFAGVKSREEAAGFAEPERVFLLYDPSEAGYAAAVLGATAGREAGSFTYKNLILKGVKPCKVTESELEAFHEAGCVCVVEKVGDVVTSEGVTASGEYLDVVDSRDYIVREIRYRTQKLLNQEEKVPYDNNGIALLESVCVNVLENAYAAGMIAQKEGGGGDYTVEYAPRSGTLPEDRAQRRYVEGKFSFSLAGAVHVVRIWGTIVI